jgi:hypothetical protein
MTATYESEAWNQGKWGEEAKRTSALTYLPDLPHPPYSAPQRCPVPVSFSPARIGMGSRFSAGGYGQS